MRITGTAQTERYSTERTEYLGPFSADSRLLFENELPGYYGWDTAGLSADPESFAKNQALDPADLRKMGNARSLGMGLSRIPREVLSRGDQGGSTCIATASCLSILRSSSMMEGWPCSLCSILRAEPLSPAKGLDKNLLDHLAYPIIGNHAWTS